MEVVWPKQHLMAQPYCHVLYLSDCVLVLQKYQMALGVRCATLRHRPADAELSWYEQVKAIGIIRTSRTTVQHCGFLRYVTVAVVVMLLCLLVELIFITLVKLMLASFFI